MGCQNRSLSSYYAAMAPHQHTITVRYGETDQMGFAHHANYLLYLEEARTALMAASGRPYGELEARGIGLPVRKANLRYRAPARFEDVLAVAVWIERLGPASITFGYRIDRPADGVHIASATMELASIDLGSGALRTLPDDLRSSLELTRETD